MREQSRLVALASLTACGLLAAVSAAPQDTQALQRMVASERAFAAATAELGVRDGFLTFFSDDAVQFEPGTAGRDTRLVAAGGVLVARPLTPLPLGARLMWNPHAGQISSDGDIGWLTGPFVVLTEATRSIAGQGAYFSVWRRQANGTWRVWLDEGIELPEVWTNASEFQANPAAVGGDGGTPTETAEEAESAAAAGGEGWTRRWADGVRIHRNGRMPVVGRSSAAAWAAAEWTEVSFHAIRVEVARSNDLAVALGGYEARSPAGPERGTWVRVWARDVRGLWRIVFETSKVVA